LPTFAFFSVTSLLCLCNYRTQGRRSDQEWNKKTEKNVKRISWLTHRNDRKELSKQILFWRCSLQKYWRMYICNYMHVYECKPRLTADNYEVCAYIACSYIHTGTGS
jgi:hypothetical protein